MARPLPRDRGPGVRPVPDRADHGRRPGRGVAREHAGPSLARERLRGSGRAYRAIPVGCGGRERGSCMAALKPHATKADYELAFKGFTYPISRAAILNMGRDKGGIDREVD